MDAYSDTISVSEREYQTAEGTGGGGQWDPGRGLPVGTAAAARGWLTVIRAGVGVRTCEGDRVKDVG